jgi:competence protein ComEC
MAFFGGVVACLQLPGLPPQWLVSGLLIAAIPCVFHRYGRLFAIAVIGFAWTMLVARQHLETRLAPGHANARITVTGRIENFPRHTGHRERFILEGRDSGGHSRRLRLAWYRSDVRPKAGECWQFRIRAHAPRGFADPGVFDYERWLFAKGIDGTGYIRSARRLTHCHTPVLLALRRRIAEAIQATVPGPDGALVKALAVGDRAGISARQWRVLRANGVSHLLAISGLHVGLAAFLAWLLTATLWRRSTRLLLRLPAPRAAAAAALVAGLGYALLAGLTISCQRALVMLAVGMTGLLFNRRPGGLAALSTALLAVLVLDPLAPLDAGFWLSFTAVAALILMATRATAGQGRLVRWWRPQFVVALGLAPLLILLFGHLSALAFPCNLVLIPLFSLVVVPLALAGVLSFLLGMPAIAGWLWGLDGWVLHGLWPALAWLAAQGWQWQAPDPGPLAALVATAGLMLAACSRRLPARTTGLLALVVLIVPASQPPPPGGFRLTLLDVGQGLASIVRTRHHTLIYDAGPAWLSGSDTGDLVVLPALRAEHDPPPALLMISHGDRDHAGGFPSLAEAFPQALVLSGEPTRLHSARARYCRRGQHWHWDGVAFRVLNPPSGFSMRGNNASCVLQISGAGGRVLLTGDIERPAEQALLGRGRDRLASRVIVVPHHGSTTSSGADFVSAVHAQAALFPVGWGNRWNFPRPAVSQRWAAAGADLLRTDCDGALTLDAEPDGHWRLSSWRRSHRHLWSSACRAVRFDNGGKYSMMREIPTRAPKSARSSN